MYQRAEPASLVLVDNFLSQNLGNRRKLFLSPHLGLVSLGSVLRAQGMPVQIFDPKRLFLSEGFEHPGPAFFALAAERILELKPRVVGFTALGVSFPFAVETSRALRELAPNLPILLGGPHATLLSEAVLTAFPWIDAIVRHEAETTLPEIVRRLLSGKDLSDVPNVAIRTGNAVHLTEDRPVLTNLDALPPQDWGLYPDDVYQGVVPVEVGRGCPYVCTFCSTASFFQRRYRLRSVSSLLSEMDRLHSAYGVRDFYLNHDLFGLKRSHLLRFCSEIAGRGFRWRASMRPDTVDAALVGAMARSGCAELYLGIETGSRRLQQSLQKGLDLERTLVGLRSLVGEGIACTASFITGLPEETQAEQDETLDLAGECLAIGGDRVSIQLHAAAPEPGTPLSLDSRSSVAFDAIDSDGARVDPSPLLKDHAQLFSPLWHYRSGAGRRADLVAVLLINRVVPSMGTDRVLDLIRMPENGSLAALARRARELLGCSRSKYGKSPEDLTARIEQTLNSCDDRASPRRRTCRVGSQ